MITRRTTTYLFFLLVIAGMVLSGCQPQADEAAQAAQADLPSTLSVEATVSEDVPDSPAPAPVEFSLITEIIDGRMVFVGVGGEIDGVVNPDLVVQSGATIRAILTNGDGIPHDLAFPDFKAKTQLVSSKGKTTEVTFTAGEDKAGTYAYYCTQPGHRQAGQEGVLVVKGP